MYSGLPGEQDESGGASAAMMEGQKRGVIFEVGHGGGSFAWRVAVPMVKASFRPDSIETDLHVGCMNKGMSEVVPHEVQRNSGSVILDVL